jgi:hypothetical protein
VYFHLRIIVILQKKNLTRKNDRKKNNFSELKLSPFTCSGIKHGQYLNDAVITGSAVILPADAPKYLVHVILDEPQVIKETHGYQL